MRGESTIIGEAGTQILCLPFGGQGVRGCTSNCNVNVLTFSDGRKFISGNKCERGARAQARFRRAGHLRLQIQAPCSHPRTKRRRQSGKSRAERSVCRSRSAFTSSSRCGRGSSRRAGSRVVLSEESSRQLYSKGSTPSRANTVCYPAKLTHGHIESLLDARRGFHLLPLRELQPRRGQFGQPLQLPRRGVLPRTFCARTTSGWTGRISSPRT